ncbi:MAG TPA: heme exporter protein CcmD [Pyrinomonadaceae bacterium]|jgi:heme exporter protein CcmD
MNWPDLSMGGYGFYVWGSYIASLIFFVWEVVSLRQRKQKTEPSAVAPGKSSSTGAAIEVDPALPRTVL